MIQSILFPVDFSPSSVGMAPFVKRAAGLFGAKVTLLHVVEILSSGFELVARSVREVEEDREYLARERLNAFLTAEFPIAECSRTIRVGDATARIAQVAREDRFDLIVMPTHAGTFRRMLLGSTTAKVLNDADCPVLTTQHAETVSPRPLDHREWVCAIGLQTDSERVIRYAGQAAQSVHANLSVIHAIPAIEAGVSLQLDLEERVQSTERQAAARLVEELLKNAVVGARVHIAVGAVKEALTEAARSLNADALIIGRSPQAGVRLRDLTYSMVRDAPCAVLSV